MVDSDGEIDSSGGEQAPAPRLSYKFQRLRERIRAAIAAGELAGKLPGERSLARQFNVNAKTLSKALTDLAAEGVLQRNIGLGTFVRDESASPISQKILLLADEQSTLTPALTDLGLDVQHHSLDGELLPSLFAPYDLVLVASSQIEDEQVRDLIVRGKNVLTIDRQTRPYSTHALLTHTSVTATRAAQWLHAMGHNHLVLVTNDSNDTTTRQTISNGLPYVKVNTVDSAEAMGALNDGATAVICDYADVEQVLAAVRTANIAVPDSLSVMGYGRVNGDAACCGHYVTDRQIAQAVRDLLVAGLPHQPVTLWLAGEHLSRGTTAPPAMAV